MASHYKRNGWYWLSYYEGGVRKQVPLKTKDKTVANFKKNEIENKLAVGENPLPNRGKLFKEAFEEFKESRKGRLDEKHQSTDNHRIQTFIDDSGIMLIRQVSDEILKKHLDKRINPGKGKVGISHQTANHTIRAIKTLLNFCIRRKYLSENPIKDMSKYPMDQKEPRYLSKDEALLLLKMAEPSVIYFPVAIAIYTGMRQGEIMRMDWRDVDFKENVIKVPISKTKRFRIIPLHTALKSILEPSRQANGLVFDRPLRTLEWEFTKIKLSMKGVEHFRFHDLRHTFASLMVRAGVDILTVSKLLGHSSITTTQIYAHLYQDHAQDSMRKLQI